MIVVIQHDQLCCVCMCVCASNKGMLMKCNLDTIGIEREKPIDSCNFSFILFNTHKFIEHYNLLNWPKYH